MKKPFGGVGALYGSNVHDITDPQPKFYNSFILHKVTKHCSIHENIMCKHNIEMLLRMM